MFVLPIKWRYVYFIKEKCAMLLLLQPRTEAVLKLPVLLLPETTHLSTTVWLWLVDFISAPNRSPKQHIFWITPISKFKCNWDLVTVWLVHPSQGYVCYKELQNQMIRLKDKGCSCLAYSHVFPNGWGIFQTVLLRSQVYHLMY